METQHNYDGRTLVVDGDVYFWGRAKGCTDVLKLGDTGEDYLFTLPYLVSDDADIKFAVRGWLKMFKEERMVYSVDKNKEFALEMFGYNAAMNMITLIERMKEMTKW